MLPSGLASYQGSEVVSPMNHHKASVTVVWAEFAARRHPTKFLPQLNHGYPLHETRALYLFQALDPKGHGVTVNVTLTASM